VRGSGFRKKRVPINPQKPAAEMKSGMRKSLMSSNGAS
jgi:hypothetical protein